MYWNNKELDYWIAVNKLKFNDEKIEFLILGTKQQVRKIIIKFRFICVGTATIPAGTDVKNLGVVFDSNVGFDKHISKVTPTCYFHLRNIAYIGKYITQSAAETISHF